MLLFIERGRWLSMGWETLFITMGGNVENVSPIKIKSINKK